ncbi:hypothetical protein T02_5984 [Trichinella nativa]|uniref:Uncharacterized protein n=1 Tax=Trichinella nativa TaxID=6335 RepID=A0A0V1KKN2_9BILA|nr:hypothetical protein T02_5984 [Trichinella nativa]
MAKYGEQARPKNVSKKTPDVGKARTDGKGQQNKLKDSIAKHRVSSMAGRVGTPGMTRAKANK